MFCKVTGVLVKMPTGYPLLYELYKPYKLYKPLCVFLNRIVRDAKTLVSLFEGFIVVSDHEEFVARVEFGFTLGYAIGVILFDKGYQRVVR